MKYIHKITYFFGSALLLTCMLSFSACNIDKLIDPNGPSLDGIVADATIGDLQNVVSGIEAGMRIRLGTYHDGVGMIGREWYRFSGSDPRFTSDLLGKGAAVLDNNTFYTTNTFAARYRTVKNCNILIEAVNNSSAAISAEEKNGYMGFAHTVMAYQLLMVLNQQHNNGIRVDVDDPDNLGPFLSREASLDAIHDLLDDAEGELAAAGTEFQFALSSGFAGFADPATFLQFNRAITARVKLYQEDWTGAITAVMASFFDMGGDMNIGVYHPFSTSGGDLANEVFFPPNATGEARVAHPDFVTEAEAGDGRLSKVSQRDATLFQDDLSSDYDVFVYQSQNDPIPIIRNEELHLIYAEARIQTDAPAVDVLMAIDAVRSAAGLTGYTGDMSKSGLLDELLHERRYSLFGEGHRWIDMRRYDRLGDLPIDRSGDDVWVEFPRPATETE